MHAKISSLKSQLDLQKLEDAKRIYEKDKKLKKALEALKAFKETSKHRLENKNNGDEAEGEDDNNFDLDLDLDLDKPTTPVNIDGHTVEVPADFAVESDDEDPEEIERNIKKMLAEEEELKKEQEETQKDEPPPELENDDNYLVDRGGFEQAIESNPMFEGAI